MISYVEMTCAWSRNIKNDTEAWNRGFAKSEACLRCPDGMEVVSKVT